MPRDGRLAPSRRKSWRFAGEHHPVAILEIADGVGERRRARSRPSRDTSRHRHSRSPAGALRAPIIRSSSPAKMKPSAKAPRNCGNAVLTASTGLMPR